MVRGLYAIVDNDLRGKIPHAILAEHFIKGGAKFVQLRWKIRGSALREMEQIQQVAKQILVLKRTYDFKFIVNDHIHVAKDVNSDGVHLGSDDMDLKTARQLMGRTKLIGYSAHSVEEVQRAEEAGANYTAFGAIYPTSTKSPGHPVQGIEKLKEVVRLAKKPLVAIGGIHRGNFQDVLATGVPAVAMISALVSAQDIPAEVLWYQSQFNLYDTAKGTHHRGA